MFRYLFLFLFVLSVAGQTTTSPRTVNLPADLANVPIPITPPVVSLTAVLLGTSTIGDTGNGTFYWSYSSTLTPDGMDVFLSNNPSYVGAGRWLRLLAGSSTLLNAILSNAGFGTNISLIGSTYIENANIQQGSVANGLQLAYNQRQSFFAGNTDNAASQEFVAQQTPVVVQTITELLAIPHPIRGLYAAVMTGPLSGTWQYCPDELAPDNASTLGTIRRPSDIPTDAETGRWMFMSGDRYSTTVDSIASLRAANPQLLTAKLLSTNSVVLSTVTTQGYYTNGDGGGATWGWTTNLSNTNLFGGKIAADGGAWKMLNWLGDVRQFGVNAQELTRIVPYTGTATTSTSLGTGDFTVASQFRVPSTLTATPEGLLRIRKSTGLDRLFSVFLSTGNLDIVLLSTNALDNAGSGGVTDGGRWHYSQSWVAGDTNILTVTRVGQNLTVYLNGVSLSGTYTNQQAFGETMADAASNYLEAGTGYWPDLFDGELFFRDRQFESAFWASALSAPQAADPFAVGGDLGTITMDETTLVDYSANLQAAIDYTSNIGGGNVVLPPGYTRVDTNINVKQGVSLIGSGASYMQDRSALGVNVGAVSWLLPWYGMETNVVQVYGSDMAHTGTPGLNNVATGDGTLVTSWTANVTLQNFGIYGPMMENGNLVQLYAVLGVTADNLTLFAPIGSPLYMYGCNEVSLHKFNGLGKGKGFYVDASADITADYMMWGSTRAPVWTFKGAGKNTLSLSHLFNNLGQRLLTPTVNTNTDVLTIPIHRLVTGNVVMFSTNVIGTNIPAGLSTNTMYYVYKVDDNNIKVNTQLGQGSVLGGAEQGVGTDMTDEGSPGFYINNGYNANVVVYNSNQETIVNNRLDQSYVSAIVGNNMDSSTIMGNMTSEHGWLNSTNGISAEVWNNVTNASAIHLLSGSNSNYLSGNTLANRNISASFGRIGIQAESGSAMNIFDGCVNLVEIPVVLNDRHQMFSPTFFQSNGDMVLGNPYMSSTDNTGYAQLTSGLAAPSGTPVQINGSTPLFSSTSGSVAGVPRLFGYFSGGWRYLPWSETSGRMTFAPGGTTVPFRTIGLDANNQENYQYSDTAGSGILIFQERFRGSQAAPRRAQSGDTLWSIRGGGGFAVDDSTSASAGGTTSEIVASTIEAFTSTAQGTRITFQTTPAGSTTRQVVLQLQVPTAARDTSLLIYDLDSNTTHRVGSTNKDFGDGVTRAYLYLK